MPPEFQGMAGKDLLKSVLSVYSHGRGEALEGSVVYHGAGWGGSCCWPLGDCCNKATTGVAAAAGACCSLLSLWLLFCTCPRLTPVISTAAKGLQMNFPEVSLGLSQKRHLNHLPSSMSKLCMSGWVTCSES